MKYIFLILSLTFFDNGCSNSKINQDVLSLKYTAQSRGPYKCIIINKKTISILNKREGKPSVKTCSKTDWNSIIKALKTVDVKNVPNLKAPSQKRLFDGAPIGGLKITYNGTIYESQSFDHGNPPKEIATLVKEILSISENIE